MLVAQANCWHLLRGFAVPLGAYLDEVVVCRQAAKASELRFGDRIVRAAVERTLGMKFRHGQRGFRQWLLKHEPWTRRAPKGNNDLRKDNRGKIKEPTLRLNPTMEIFFANRHRLAIRVGKRYGLRATKIESGCANNDLSRKLPSEVISARVY
jgi:hypothetical protein